METSRRCLGCGWDFPASIFAGVLCEECRLSHLAGSRNYWGIATAAPGMAPTAFQAQLHTQQQLWIYSQGDNIR